MDAKTFRMLHECAHKGITNDHADRDVVEAGRLLCAINGNMAADALGMTAHDWSEMVVRANDSQVCVYFTRAVLTYKALEPAVRLVLEEYLAMESL